MANVKNTKQPAKQPPEDAMASDNGYVSPTTFDDTSGDEQNHRKGEGWECLAR